MQRRLGLDVLGRNVTHNLVFAAQTGLCAPKVVNHSILRRVCASESSRQVNFYRVPREHTFCHYLVARAFSASFSSEFIATTAL